MIAAAVHCFDVDVGLGSAREAVEEVGQQLGLEIADQRHRHLIVDHAGDAAAEVDGGDGERLVHRHDEVSGAQDAFFIAQRDPEGLAHSDAHVLDGVVLIDVEVALAGEDRLKPPWRVKSSSMWSKKRMPVETGTPWPSMVSV